MKFRVQNEKRYYKMVQPSRQFCTCSHYYVDEKPQSPAIACGYSNLPSLADKMVNGDDFHILGDLSVVFTQIVLRSTSCQLSSFKVFVLAAVLDHRALRVQSLGVSKCGLAYARGKSK